MSKAGCSGGSAANKARFKGVENFLKRVAYNLGNSPSQTDVKIISCIPIDVSDLQQKIICLEKQLEETKCFQMTSMQQKPIINTALCDCPRMLNTGVSCNMLDTNRSTSPCPPCKGSHIHHRRFSRKKSNVSFVEPSGKTRTCTCHLEDSIECSCSQAGKLMSEEKCYPYLAYDNNSPFMGGDSKPRGYRKNIFSRKNKCCKYKKPKTQCVYYAQTRSTPFNTATNQSKTIPKRPKVMTQTYLAEMINKQYKPRTLGGNLSEISNFSAPVCRDSINFSRPNCYESDLCSCFHDGYQDIDKHLNANQNSYLINSNGLIAESGYYDSTFYDVFPVKEKPVKTKNYVDMPKKRELRPWTDVRKPTEDIPEVAIHPMHNTLHGNCQTLPLSTETILHKVSRINRRQANPSVAIIPKRRNRMSNIHDREIKMQESKSCNTFRNPQLHPKIINTLHEEDKSLEVIQEPRKSDAECLTTLVTSNDCQTGTSIDNDRTNTDVKTENTLNQIKNILQSVIQEVKDTAVLKFSTDEKVKKDADIQKDIQQINIAGNVQNNNLQDSKRENVQSNIPGNIHGNKLSSALGNMAESQQSNMGYSFSGAVPFNTQMPMQGSRFLSSFTYSPYANNQCMPSCSKQLNSNSYCYSSPPAFKYFMNYPVYMHSPERHICASCYRHNSHLNTQFNKVTTIATNTEQIIEENRNETHKLIKEIYKSIAMNVDGNNKGISSSKVEVVQKYSNDAKEIEKSKKKEARSPSVKEFRKSTNVIQAVSELFRKKEMLVSTDSPNTTTMESIQESVDVILHSSTDIRTKLGKTRQGNLSNYNTSDEKPVEICTSTQNSETTSVSETATTTESEVTLVSPESKTFQRTPREKKEKLGLFSKMIKSVFKQKDKKNFDKKDNSVESIDTEEESSDSDDYQTIYSQKVERPLRYTPKANNFPKRRTHSKISYNKQGYQSERHASNIIRRSPYMEQEYRRHWTEKLMFHDDRRRQSSDLPTNSYSYTESRSPFFQKYEARTAVLQPKNNTYQSIDAKRVIPYKDQKLSEEAKPKMATKRLAWLKNCKFECKKEHWKKLITDN